MDSSGRGNDRFSDHGVCDALIFACLLKIIIIKAGGGRPPKLSLSDQIIQTLVYLHNLPTFQMLGVQFGLSESAANYIFYYWLGIIRELLPASLVEQVKI